MDARLLRIGAPLAALVLFGTMSPRAGGATYTSKNFVVTAPDIAFARQVAETAERYRVALAREWLGEELQTWYHPCQVSVTVGQIGAGGQTTFTFAGGQVFGWDMRVQGTAERILDSVVPHEVSHTIFASYFRRPLPRWADEGAASLVEHESERGRQQHLLEQVFNTPRRIPLTTLISMKEYPADMQNVLTMYAEGYSLANYLVQMGGETGKTRFLNFLKDANKHDWNYAIHAWYGLPDVASLERHWSNWVLAGSPDPGNDLIAQADARARKSGQIVRSQSPDKTASSSPSSATARAARPAKPIPRGDQLVAPEPVDRTKLADRSQVLERTASAAIDDSETLQRRREGRERMFHDGWQPVSIAEKGRRYPSDDRQASRGQRARTDKNAADESPARKKFRDAQQRLKAPQPDAPNEDESPFTETETTVTEQDIATAQTPFHTEN